MGRTAAGVRGIRLPEDGENHEVIALLIVGDGQVLCATENGYGKRTPLADFPVQGRGGQGVIAQNLTDKSGKLVGAIEVHENDEVMLISEGGTLIRTSAKEISVQGRNTQGVRVMRPDENDRLVGLDRIEPENVDNGGGDSEEAPTA